jgi:plasmid stabilization system protein ParE
MKFFVIWARAAQDERARVWNNAVDRAAVTAAANRIDSLLRRNPSSMGESRGGTTRVLFVTPPAVTFRVSEPDLQVYVLDVWRTRQ